MRAPTRRSLRPQSARRYSFRPALLCLECRDAPAVLTVTNLSDADPGSLRAQIAAAHTGDTIAFTAGLSGTIALTSGELQLTKNLTITGPGANRLAVSGNGASRVFEVFANQAVVMSNLTVTGGLAEAPAPDRHGGGIVVDVNGILFLTNCAVVGNSAVADAGGIAQGGGIWNAGSVTLTGCTVSGNTADGSAGSRSAGGGIFSTGSLTLSTCTVAGNTATDGLLLPGQGGGISSTGTLTLTSCTVAGNAATDGGGVFSGGPAALNDTIVAGNRGDAVHADVDGLNVTSSLGYNLIGNSGGDPNSWRATDLVGGAAQPLDAGLGSLGDYGGPTQTVSLRAGSPALNVGDPAQAYTSDQRGVYRAGSSTIGAFQATALTLTLAAPATVTAGAPFAATVTALDPFGQVAVGYTGTVYLSSTDYQDPFLDSATFTVADGGSFTFTGELLYTTGPQTLFVTDYVINGGSVGLTVTPAVANRLQFTYPGPVQAGIEFQLVVTVYDAYGNVATNFTGTLRLSRSDGAPVEYAFGAADAGTHAFAVTIPAAGLVAFSISDPGDAPVVADRIDLYAS